MLGTWLVVTAHPDDESFSIGGSIAKYAAAGTRVVLACATLGEEGKAGDPPLCTKEELPRVREAELRRAAETLGIGVIELLGYRDKELQAVALEEGAERVADLVARYRPDVVSTFPPNGISGHPDHRAICLWTTEALRRLRPGGTAPSLYYWAAPPRFGERAGQPVAASDLRRSAVIDVAPFLEQKIAAIRAHRTQHLSIERVFGSFDAATRKWMAEEGFYRVWPELPPGWEAAPPAPGLQRAGGAADPGRP